MARPPKKVSATSGQGVSRRSYQVSRSLGMKGTGSPGPNPLRNVAAGEANTSSAKAASQKREYPKGGGFSYTEREMGNPDLTSLVGVGKRKPPKLGKGFL